MSQLRLKHIQGRLALSCVWREHHIVEQAEDERNLNDRGKAILEHRYAPVLPRADSNCQLFVLGSAVVQWSLVVMPRSCDRMVRDHVSEP